MKGSSAAPEASSSVSGVSYVRAPIYREKKIETASSAALRGGIGGDADAPRASFGHAQ